MRRTRVKVCGMRKPEQAAQLVDLGVDAIGMIFYESSPRCITLDQAKLVRQAVPAFVNLVGVFVNTDSDEINAIADNVGLDLIQLHGDQSLDFANHLSKPYIKVIRVKNQEIINQERQIHSKAQGYLLDTFSDSAYGGTGHCIEHELLSLPLQKNTILAGGINVDNIDSVLTLNPYAVDVNSGVEITPGDKDIKKIELIMNKIYKFDQEYC